MQEQKSKNLEFYSRTEKLAQKLGCKVSKLHEHLGLSKATVFAGRSEGGNISLNTWNALEQAEARYGINQEQEQNAPINRQLLSSVLAEGMKAQLSSKGIRFDVLDSEFSKPFVNGLREMSAMKSMIETSVNDPDEVDRLWSEAVELQAEKKLDAVEAVYEVLQSRKKADSKTA